MRRRLLRLGVLLLVGVALNLAIAWSAVYWSDPAVFDARFLAQLRTSQWERGDGTDTSGQWIRIAFRSRGRDIILTDISPSGETGGGRSLPAARLTTHLTGWPMRSMAGDEVAVFHGRAGTQVTMKHVHALLLKGVITPQLTASPGSRMAFFATARILPLHPIWRGFILNSSLYGAAIWLLLATAALTRRLVRRWRRQCTNCGYPVGASPICTECGSPLRRVVAPRHESDIVAEQ